MADILEKPDKGKTEKVEVQKLESGELTRDFPNIDEKKLLRKIDLYIVPILTLLYLLSFIDRANIVGVFVYTISRTRANITSML
jgi:hypothetical protein